MNESWRYRRGRILNAIQNFIIASGLYKLILMAGGVVFKFYYIAQFGRWRKVNHHSGVLYGFKERFDLYDAVITKENLKGIIYLEFGVAQGNSIKWWLKRVTDPDSRFYGFDSFEGLPEDWGLAKKGAFTNQGALPEVNDERCTFVKGWFNQTLPGFLAANQFNKRIVVHFDADLYSSTMYAWINILPILKPNDIIIFDEFDVTTHEFRALLDMETIYGIKYELVGECGNFNRTVIKVK